MPSAAMTGTFTASTTCGTSVAGSVALIPFLEHLDQRADDSPAMKRVLQKKDSFFTVQRDAMDIDELKSPALYVGTTTGQLWIGREGGEEWDCAFDSLPPIQCVNAAVV
jgi:hypothetical protein